MKASGRVVVRGLEALGACTFAAVLVVTAVAQPAPVPVRVIQGSDGTLYVVQGGNSWTLVPDQASDSDVAALNLAGAIDGTFPNQLFIVQTPASPPVAAPAPPAAQPPAEATTGCSTPVTGTVDLTGKVADDVPGTCIAVGATVTSVVSSSTKTKDVYAVALTAGANYQLLFTWPNNTPNSQVRPAVLSSPNLATLQTADAPGNGIQCAWIGTNTPCTFTVAISDTYYVQVTALRANATRYTFMVRQI